MFYEHGWANLGGHSLWSQCYTVEGLVVAGLALRHTNEADWVQRTNEYGLRRPTRASQIFVYRAFDLWSQMGPMYRATDSG